MLRRYVGTPGECLLVRLPRADRRTWNLVILGGAGWSQPGAGERLRDVVADLGATCQGWFDIVAVTDHTSAFIDALQPLAPEQLWLPWTEDPNDPVARALASDRDAAVASLRRSATRLQIQGDQRRAQRVATVLASLSPNRRQGPRRASRPGHAGALLQANRPAARAPRTGRAGSGAGSAAGPRSRTRRGVGW